MLRRMGVSSIAGLLSIALLPVCSAQSLQTDSTSAAARVETLTGQVAVLRDSQPWALVPGSEIRPQQIILTGPDGYARFRVSDGSTFEVFPNSRVTFRNTPGDWKDLLEMWLGRVKVHIEKLGGQPNHNRVRTPTAIISVRGTTFDVAVEEAETTLVVVDEGTVEVRHALKGGDPKLLNANEWVRVYKNAPLAQKRFDRGSVIHSALRAAADAIYTTIYRTGGSTPTGGGGNGGGLPGDHDGGKKDPPPPSGGSTTGGSAGGGSTTPPPDAGTGAPPPPM
ncbi:MAG TPA: FecR family protein [Bryobacteraceae bacterium]|nr:FecR family protein [Bryobacteraceae bacterium]